MMEAIYNLAGDTLFLVTVVLVFLSASTFMFLLMTVGQKFMVGYKETFTESASAIFKLAPARMAPESIMRPSGNCSSNLRNRLLRIVL